jgi:hypothetical protein
MRLISLVCGRSESLELPRSLLVHWYIAMPAGAIFALVPLVAIASLCFFSTFLTLPFPR